MTKSDYRSVMSYATFLDVVECKGRIGREGSIRERLAKRLARRVASAIMRDPQIRKEFTLAIGMELIRHKKEYDKMFGRKDR